MAITQEIPKVGGEPPRPRGPRPGPRQTTLRFADERPTLYGSAAAALALVWVVYTQVLPFTGWFGFLLCWYGAFLFLYAFTTRLGNPWPVVVDRLASVAFRTAALIVAVALATTVAYTIYRGFPALRHLNFYTQDMSGVGPNDPLTQGGVLHAIVGTLIEIGIAIAVALPLGLTTAVYMTEVRGKLSRIVRTVVEAMTALPEILAGLFIYVVLIVQLGYPRSGFAAAVAISVTMIPITARSSEVALRVVPGGLREASLALGASHWQTVRRVVLPTAKTGLATALILGIARGIGEVAVVLICSGASTYLTFDPFHEPMNSLPLYAFTAVRSGQEIAVTRGFGAASVLLVVVLVLFVTTRLLARGQKGTR